MSNTMLGNLILSYSPSKVDVSQLERNLNSLYWINGFWEINFDYHHIYFRESDDYASSNYGFLKVDHTNNELEEATNPLSDLANAICPCVKEGDVELISTHHDSEFNARISSFKFFSNGNAVLEEIKVEEGEFCKFYDSFQIRIDNNIDREQWYAISVRKLKDHQVNGKFYTNNKTVIDNFIKTTNFLEVHMSVHGSENDVVDFLNKFNDEYCWIEP